MDQEEIFEGYCQSFYEADANERERIMEILRELAKEDAEYAFLIAELEAYEAEEDLEHGETFSPKDEI